MSAFKVGDRVTVKPECCDVYTQPWRGRFEAGRIGTVVGGPSDNIRGYMVEWDSKRAKYPRDWRLVMDPRDIQPVSQKEPQQ